MRPSRGSKEFGQLVDAITARPELFIITGAGLSTASGIPAYRDESGHWCAKKPILHQEFIQSEDARKRYWARSLVGWRYFTAAQPNVGHQALFEMERSGFSQILVTQNVDRLHQRAGSNKVIDLHGRLDRICCLNCGRKDKRSDFQVWLEKANPNVTPFSRSVLPDGDADVVTTQMSEFVVPTCVDCAGHYMPEVVFYGGAVPRDRIERIYDELDHCKALLIIGTSLMAYSVYQFCRAAVDRGLPIFAINKGKTRHDGRFDLKIEQSCAEVLPQLSTLLRGG